MGAARKINKSLSLLYPRHKDGEKLYGELQDALEKIFRITPENPGWDLLILHVRQALSFAVDVQQRRGGFFFNKKHYADPLTITKKFASLSDPHTPPIVDEETYLASILYPAFHVKRSEGNFASQYAGIHRWLNDIWSVFSDEAGKLNKAFTRNVRDLIIETLELSEIDHRIKLSPVPLVSRDQDRQKIIEEFHDFAYVIAERVRLSGPVKDPHAKKEPRALKIRLAQRSVRIDDLKGRLREEQIAAYNLETNEIYISLATSYKLSAIKKRLQRQMQLMANAETFVAASMIVQNRRSMAAFLTKEKKEKASSCPRTKEAIVFEYLENMLREIAPNNHTYRFEWRFKDEESTCGKILTKGEERTHDVIGIRQIVKATFSRKRHGSRTEAEYDACRETHKALRAIASNPNNVWGLREQTGGFDDYIDGKKLQEEKTMERGYRALHHTLEIVVRIGSATVSFPFELQITGEELHTHNTKNADHDRYKGIHKVDLNRAKRTTSVIMGKGQPVSLPRGAHVMDYFVAKLGAEKALTVCNPRTKGIRDYGHLLDPDKQETEIQVLRKIPRTGTEISYDLDPTLLHDETQIKSRVSACLLQRSRQQLARTIRKLHLHQEAAVHKAARIQSSAHYMPPRPAFGYADNARFPDVSIV